MRVQMKPNFTNEVKTLMLNASNGYCQCNPACLKKVSDFHHKLSNTKVNQKKFPLFLQSPFNCCPISRNCHINRAPKIRESLAMSYEKWLGQKLAIAQN